MNWKKIVCLFKGHRWFVIEFFSPHSRKIGCRRCHQEWGMNDQVQALVPWNDDLQEFYKGEWRKPYEGL